MTCFTLGSFQQGRPLPPSPLPLGSRPFILLTHNSPSLGRVVNTGPDTGGGQSGAETQGDAWVLPKKCGPEESRASGPRHSL